MSGKDTVAYVNSQPMEVLLQNLKTNIDNYYKERIYKNRKRGRYMYCNEFFDAQTRNVQEKFMKDYVAARGNETKIAALKKKKRKDLRRIAAGKSKFISRLHIWEFQNPTIPKDTVPTFFHPRTDMLPHLGKVYKPHSYERSPEYTGPSSGIRVRRFPSKPNTGVPEIKTR